MSASLKLYIDFISPASRSLYIALKQSGLPFEKVLIDLAKEQHLTNEYKNLNRFQKVPCITQGDFKLAESVAIFRYLASTNKGFDKLFGNNEQKRARIDEYLEWNYSLRKETLNFFHLDWLTPYRTGSQPPKDELENARRDIDNIFENLQEIWLNSSKFVVGNELTVADIFGVSEIQQTILSKLDVGKKYPKIAEWIESVRQETNPHFDEAHNILYRIAKKSIKGSSL